MKTLSVDRLDIPESTHKVLVQDFVHQTETTYGIQTVYELVRSERDNLIRLYRFGNAAMLDVRLALMNLGLELAEQVSGPCIDALDGDYWIRLRKTTSRPSWLLRSELGEVSLARIIGASYIFFLRSSLQIDTIDDVCLWSRAQIELSLDWEKVPKPSKLVLDRLENEIGRLGLQLAQ
ncbi:MAG: hypothetical protein WCO19_04825 [Candidatus Saccharibacteria bacterium]